MAGKYINDVQCVISNCCHLGYAVVLCASHFLMNALDIAQNAGKVEKNYFLVNGVRVLYIGYTGEKMDQDKRMQNVPMYSKEVHFRVYNEHILIKAVLCSHYAKNHKILRHKKRSFFDKLFVFSYALYRKTTCYSFVCGHFHNIGYIIEAVYKAK